MLNVFLRFKKSVCVFVRSYFFEGAHVVFRNIYSLVYDLCGKYHRVKKGWNCNCTGCIKPLALCQKLI